MTNEDTAKLLANKLTPKQGTKKDIVERLIAATLQYGEDNGSCPEGMAGFLAEVVGGDADTIEQNIEYRDAKYVTLTISFYDKKASERNYDEIIEMDHRTLTGLVNGIWTNTVPYYDINPLELDAIDYEVRDVEFD